jgi:poly-gamma-glutamate synthesis protein (capsule biosynthesis protein)
VDGVRDSTVVLALCGDVMLGRGVDQILPHPGDPTLWEDYVRDARTYVQLAEARNGPIPYPVDMVWPWGDALAALDRAAPHARILNLETSVTQGGAAAPGKGIHYRLNPANLSCLAVARPDACVLANNHVLDFGRHGLADTLQALARAGLRGVGAGADLDEAWRPAVVPTGAGRVLVVAFGMPSSGVPPSWAATAERSGVAFVPDLSEERAAAITDRVRRLKRSGDVVVASVHWGPNWGYHVGPDEARFAHALVDGGVDVVYGHSSHHPRPIEIYRRRLVLYGCGDLVNDYEGIGGREQYRDDLRLLYFASVDAGTGELVRLRMTPLQARRMRLRRATAADSRWLQAVLDPLSRDLNAGVSVEAGDTLAVTPGCARAAPAWGRLASRWRRSVRRR